MDAKLPDPSAFERDEQEGCFTATFRVEGEVRLSIKAADLEAARQQALDEMSRLEEAGVELDYVYSVGRPSVRQDPTMYLVLRDGKPMRSSRLEPGDQPRAPTETGF